MIGALTKSLLTLGRKDEMHRRRRTSDDEHIALLKKRIEVNELKLRDEEIETKRRAELAEWLAAENKRIQEWIKRNELLEDTDV